VTKLGEFSPNLPNFRLLGNCLLWAIKKLWPMPLFVLSMHIIKSFYTQQHCYGSLKNLIPWRDSNPGLLVPDTDAMTTAPRRQGVRGIFYITAVSQIFALFIP
jgi:hypothetical protein